MYKKLAIFPILAFVMGLVVVPTALAKSPEAPKGPAVKSDAGLLYHVEKDSDWEIVKGRAWGKMEYNLTGQKFEFVFNGHGLEPGWDYSLIYHSDPRPGIGLVCLAAGTATEDGDLQMPGSVITPGDLESAKIWLVLSNHVNCQGQHLLAWDLPQYLFEYELINSKDPND